MVCGPAVPEEARTPSYLAQYSKLMWLLEHLIKLA